MNGICSEFIWSIYPWIPVATFMIVVASIVIQLLTLRNVRKTLSIQKYLVECNEAVKEKRSLDKLMAERMKVEVNSENNPSVSYP